MAFPVIAAALGLANFVPVIARWLGSDKAEEAAAQVVDIAKKVTGASNPVQAIQCLEDNPDMVGAFQVAIMQVEAKIELAMMEDRQDARTRDLSLTQKGRGNLRADLMVIASAIGLVLCLVTLACFPVTLPGEAVGVIATIAGIFGSCLKDAYGFEFGSSRGSKEKDDTVASLIDKYSRFEGKE